MNAPKILIISTSLHSESRSRLLADFAMDQIVQTTRERGLNSSNPSVQRLDMVDYPLPLCDGQAAYGDPNVRAVSAKIAEADGILLSAPIYNYDVNAVAKNMIELTGKAAWQDKTVGLMCAAGGTGSYMSLMPLANSLMLDFRCLVLPRFVYALGSSFQDDKLIDPEISKRVKQLGARLVQICQSLPVPADD